MLEGMPTQNGLACIKLIGQMSLLNGHVELSASKVLFRLPSSNQAEVHRKLFRGLVNLVATPNISMSDRHLLVRLPSWAALLLTHHQGLLHESIDLVTANRNRRPLFLLKQRLMHLLHKLIMALMLSVEVRLFIIYYS